MLLLLREKTDQIRMENTGNTEKYNDEYVNKKNKSSKGEICNEKKNNFTIYGDMHDRNAHTILGTACMGTDYTVRGLERESDHRKPDSHHE